MNLLESLKTTKAKVTMMGISSVYPHLILTRPVYSRNHYRKKSEDV